MTRSPARSAVLILAAAALLSGCGSHASGDGASAQSTTKNVGRKAVNPGDAISRNMVSAVASNKPSTLPVQVKFELRDRPDIGQPVTLDLAIVPMSASVDRVSGKVEGEEGLELIEGGEIAASDRPAEGVPIRHSVKVLPKRAGIFTLRAALTVDASGVSSTESYSIPLIADTTAPEEPGKPVPAPASPTRDTEPHARPPPTAAAQ
ncbi:MAG TPA: hypothetical protein VE819_01125 [Steroidobacteraceae bacterium]|nr:hypothetical protein [Steroidobacteraceae bacterium]